MDRNILVCVDLLGTPHLVGRLWARTRRDKERATFQYADGWLANPNRFSLALTRAELRADHRVHATFEEVVSGSLKPVKIRYVKPPKREHKILGFRHCRI